LRSLQHTNAHHSLARCCRNLKIGLHLYHRAFLLSERLKITIII
jgi:hypothetical protein